MKSNRTASHAVWLPILIGSALALSKTKNCVVYLTTPHSPARSVNLHSLDTSLHHAVKSLVFCKLQSYGASSQEGLPCTDFSTPHRKILRPIKMVFDDILCTYQCNAGGGGEAGHRVGIRLFSKICPRANHSSQMQPNFPTPGCTLLSVPRQNLRKAQ